MKPAEKKGTSKRLVFAIGITVGLCLLASIAVGNFLYGAGYNTGYKEAEGFYYGEGRGTSRIPPFGFWFNYIDEESYWLIEDFWVAFNINTTWTLDPKVPREHIWWEEHDFAFWGNETYRFENGTVWYVPQDPLCFIEVKVTGAYVWVAKMKALNITVTDFVWSVEYLNATAFTYEADIWFEQK